MYLTYTMAGEKAGRGGATAVMVVKGTGGNTGLAACGCSSHFVVFSVRSCHTQSIEGRGSEWQTACY